MMKTSALLIAPNHQRPARLLGLSYIGGTLSSSRLLSKIGKGSSLDLPNDIPPPHVKILDLSLTPKKFKFEDFLRRFSPTIVGVSANTHTFRESIAIAKFIERVTPNALRVIGGYHSSALPEESLLVGPFQVAVIGYGEETMTELAMALHHYGREELEDALSQIPGIAYKDATGKAQNNGRREQFLDLDELPFPHTAHNLYIFNNYVNEDRNGTIVEYISGSRGCPFRCKYCAGESLHSRRVRNRSAESILQEIRELIGLGINHVSFSEEDFLINPNAQEIIAGLEEIHRNNPQFKWSMETRGDRLDSSIIKDMADAGLTQMAFGVETADETLAKEVKRSPRLSMATIVENTQMAEAHGISVAHNLMVGLPGQDWASVLITARHLQDNPPTRAAAANYEIFPGSQYFHELRRSGQGIGLIARDGRLITLMEHMTRGEIFSAVRDLEFLFLFTRFARQYPEAKDEYKTLQISPLVDKIRIWTIYDLFINSRTSNTRRIEVIKELERSTEPVLSQLLEERTDNSSSFMALYAPMDKLFILESLRLYAEAINLEQGVKRDYLDPFLDAIKFNNALTMAHLPFSVIRMFIMIGMVFYHNLKDDRGINIDTIVFEDETRTVELIKRKLRNRTAPEINKEQDKFDWEKFIKSDSAVEFLGVPIRLDRTNNKLII